MSQTRSVRTRIAAIAAGVVLGFAALTGCTGSGGGGPTTAGGSPAPPAPSGGKLATSFQALVDRALARPELSEFERTVLERARSTGKIDAADYEEAYSRYRTCVGDAGYQVTLTKLPNGLYQETPVTPAFADNAANKTWFDAYSDASQTCATGTTMTLEALYGLQQGNEQLVADPSEVVVQCLIEAGSVSGEYTTEDFEALRDRGFTDPPFELGSSAAKTCFANAGMAVATP